MGKKDFLLIKNPVAGSGRSKNQAWIDRLIESLEKEGYSYDMVETKGHNHASDLAYEGAGDYRIIVAMGGDGTVHEVAQGLARFGGAALGILPIGNGNDYYRSYDSKVSPKTAINKLIAGNTMYVDIGLDEEDRYILNIASLGLDSYTNAIQKKIKKYFPRSLGYLIALIYSIGAYKKQRINVTLDGHSFESNNVLLCFGNGQSYGGGFRIMPWAKLDDGYFHVVNIIDLSWPILYIIAPSILFGLHTKFTKYVKVYKAKEILVEADEFTLNIDGEVFETNRIYAKVLANKLKVIV